MNTAATPHAPEPACLNCGRELNGPFCHACGQKAGGRALHFHDLAHELLHEFLHVDSKIWRTLRLLLFSPGTLTREYVNGRRARYIGPVRLFLIASVVLFGLAALAPIHMESHEATAAENADIKAAEVDALHEVDMELGGQGSSLEGSRFTAKVRRAVAEISHDPEHAKVRALNALSKSFFLLVPIFALITWIFFAKELPYYVGHMYFALHFHAFAFVLLSLGQLSSLARIPTAGLLELGVMFALLFYFFVALRRTFDASKTKTVLAGAAVLLICGVLNGIVVLAILGVLFLS